MGFEDDNDKDIMRKDYIEILDVLDDSSDIDENTNNDVKDKDNREHVNFLEVLDNKFDNRNIKRKRGEDTDTSDPDSVDEDEEMNKRKEK